MLLKAAVLGKILHLKPFYRKHNYVGLCQKSLHQVFFNILREVDLIQRCHKASRLKVRGNYITLTHYSGLLIRKKSIKSETNKQFVQPPFLKGITLFVLKLLYVLVVICGCTLCREVELSENQIVEVFSVVLIYFLLVDDGLAKITKSGWCIVYRNIVVSGYVHHFTAQCLSLNMLV